jgi:nucleoside-diphosphate-sugar epimerase
VNGEGQGNYYHVSIGKDYAIEEIFRTMNYLMSDTGKCMPKYTVIPHGPDDAETILLDCSETKEDFPGWEAKTSLDFGLEKTIQWYDKYEITQSYTHLKKEW